MLDSAKVEDLDGMQEEGRQAWEKDKTQIMALVEAIIDEKLGGAASPDENESGDQSGGEGNKKDEKTDGGDKSDENVDDNSG